MGPIAALLTFCPLVPWCDALQVQITAYSHFFACSFLLRSLSLNNHGTRLRCLYDRWWSISADAVVADGPPRTSNVLLLCRLLRAAAKLHLSWIIGLMESTQLVLLIAHHFPGTSYNIQLYGPSRPTGFTLHIHGVVVVVSPCTAAASLITFPHSTAAPPSISALF